jgi:hypothetical protein
MLIIKEYEFGALEENVLLLTLAMDLKTRKAWIPAPVRRPPQTPARA